MRSGCVQVLSVNIAVEWCSCGVVACVCRNVLAMSDSVACLVCSSAKSPRCSMLAFAASAVSDGGRAPRPPCDMVACMSAAGCPAMLLESFRQALFHGLSSSRYCLRGQLQNLAV